MISFNEHHLMMNIAANDEKFICNEGIVLLSSSNKSRRLFDRKQLQGFKYKGNRVLFEGIAAQALKREEQKYKQGEITFQTLGMFKSRLNSKILPFFGSLPLDEISYEKIAGFIQYLQENNTGAVTIKQYLGLLKRILSIGLENGWLYKLPLMPKIKANSIPRGSFTCHEYRKLLVVAKELKDPLNQVEHTHRVTAGGAYIKRSTVPFEMAWLIQFMVNSFVRPVDIKLIQHKHIEIMSGKNAYLRLKLPKTKGHSGQVVTLRAAKGVYERLKKYQLTRGYGSPEDYLFIPEAKDRQSAIQLITTHFRKILEKAKLTIGQDNQRRTLYSLRHTAITFRLLYGEGIDLLTLARNARTSVEMIERFYSSNLTAEMNIDMLQSKRVSFSK